MDDTGRFKQAHVAQWLETSRHYLFSDGEPPLERATPSSVESSQRATGPNRQDETDPLESDADPAGSALLWLWLAPRRARAHFGGSGIRSCCSANFFDGLMPCVAPGKDTGLFARDELFRKATHAFALYRNWLAAPAPSASPAGIYIPAYFGWNRT